MPHIFPDEKNAKFCLVSSLQNGEHIAKIKIKRQHGFAFDS